MNKIIIHYSSAIFCSWLFITINFSAGAQPAINKYGVSVITKVKDYRKIVAKDTGKAMVEVKIPGVETALAYASADNFMKMPLYPPVTITYLRLPALMALTKVQAELKEKGFGLKIWDAYRPYSVTVKMWEPVKDDRYVANPSDGSGHNRGVAVDLTLIYLDTKKEADMGTGFDHFSDTAHIDFKKLPANILANRALLQSVMERNGFIALKTEWWHYYLPDAKSFELLDLSFKELSKINRRRKAQKQ